MIISLKKKSRQNAKLNLQIRLGLIVLSSTNISYVDLSTLPTNVLLLYVYPQL